MFRKVFAQVLVLVLLLLAFFGTPVVAQAGGVCGGTYLVEWNDTLDSIAAMCGITVSAIYAANPGISGVLYAGQVLNLSGSANSNINNNNYYPPVNYPPVSYNGNYIVQAGDTFSGIASRYGVNIYDLWAANPYIWDINFLYAGQVIYLPTWAGQPVYPPTYPICCSVAPVPTEASVPLSYGTVPVGTPSGTVRLSNKSSGDIYVSLQGTTKGGIQVIREYPVSGTMKVNVPAGWYVYVAWVGGQKFEGQFNLTQGSNHAITFYNNKSVTE